MKKHIFAAATIFALLWSIPASAREITVLLKQCAAQATIGGQGVVLTDARGMYTKPFNGTFKATYVNGAMKAGKVTYKLPVTMNSASGVIVDGVTYKGALVIERNSNGLNFINKVDIEEYLKGVLKSEMSPTWPKEALKAQAVLARTYTLASKKHGAYDICVGTHCQVYGGAADESAVIVQAVNETKGQILTYGGDPAQIFFFSDSGGMTTGSESVWGSAIPYLTPKADPVPNDSPNKTWQATLTMAQIGNKLTAAGAGVGTLKSLRPYKRDKSGRIEQIELKGSAGTKVISGNKFRTAVGATVVKSTLFEFNSRSGYKVSTATVSKPAANFVQIPKQNAVSAHAVQIAGMPENDADKLYWMAKNKVFTMRELLSMIGDDSKYPQYVAEGLARMAKMKNPPAAKNGTPKPASPPVKTVTTVAEAAASPLSMDGTSAQTVVMYGRGYGHGVGFPQWTAKALAEAGWDYKRMLEYYFQGTQLETR